MIKTAGLGVIKYLVSVQKEKIWQIHQPTLPRLAETVGRNLQGQSMKYIKGVRLPGKTWFALGMTLPLPTHAMRLQLCQKGNDSSGKNGFNKLSTTSTRPKT